MSKRILYIARNTIKTYSIFNVKPTERWVRVADAFTFFPNISYYPIIEGLHGLYHFLPLFDVPIGRCWQVEVDETDEKCVITILDRDVFIKTVLRKDKAYDRS